MNILKNQDIFPISFFDIETTGMSPSKDRIIEIAAVRVEKDGTMTEFSSLVNPKVVIPKEIQKLTGISETDLLEAPEFREIAGKFIATVNNSTLAAHNALFDLAFLQESLKRASLPRWEGKTIDTLKLFRIALPSLASHSLSNLKDFFKVQSDYTKNHRALNDAITLKDIFLSFINHL